MGTLNELFPDYTHRFSALDQTKIARVVSVLNAHAKTQYLTGGEISRRVYVEYLGGKLKPSEIRKLINHIRRLDLCAPFILVSSQRGYKLTNDADEIAKYIQSLTERREAIQQVEAALHGQLAKMLANRRRFETAYGQTNDLFSFNGNERT